MTIAQVSKTYDISPDTLRYYERIGLLPAVGRTSGGIRNYTEYDCGWIEFIKCMRNAGLSVDALIEYVTLFIQGNTTIELRKQILCDQRDILVKKISEMQSTLDRLNYKIDNYEKKILPIQNKLAKS